MEDVHRSAIQSNFVSLVEQTDLDLMVTALYEKGVFSEQMIERYKDTRNDVRSRKRQLYVDVMSRGPNAFGHLTDALQEAGYWNLARDLDPNSSLHIRAPHINPKPLPLSTGENSFISISSEKKKTKSDIETQKILDEARSQLKPVTAEADPADNIPHFHVKKSTRFMDDNKTADIKLYRTRGPRGRRGVLLVFSYIEFQHEMEDFRSGVDVDCKKLKYLFDEFGFTVLSYLNLTKKKTVQTLKSLNLVLAGAECAFIVVSSHGYRRGGSSDADFRCHDGQLLSIYDFLEYFNNENLPVLVGIPKVFIFQICRGPNDEWHQLKMPTACEGAGAAGGTFRDGAVPWTEERAPPPPPPRARRDPPPDDVRARLYSDILIAHSTLPGFVSRRDGAEGSWYIQVVCEVFAAHAHANHVEELFTLVDLRLAQRFRIQTSSVDRWGFNRRLYLHPGMYE